MPPERRTTLLAKLIPGAVELSGRIRRSTKEEVDRVLPRRDPFLVVKPKLASLGLNWRTATA